MGQTAFVTGGSGFIGGALIRRLVREGWTVRALARSDASAEKVAALGATPVPGDLDDVAALTAGAEGAGVAFHAAASLGEWGRREDFERGNVTGTRNVLEAARDAGVRRVVHIGTEAALLTGEPLVNVDETAPLRPDSKALYSATKAAAEQAVLDANGDGLETVVVRPRLVWGKGDTTIMPGLIEAVRSGRFRWIGGGRHRTSTTHVDNVVEGLVLGAERGGPGRVYFVTDGEPVVFRDFVTELLGTQGVSIPDKSVPAGVARVTAGVGETVWGLLRRSSPPPVTRLAYWLSALETTIDISRAREELGYEPVTTIPEGMDELRGGMSEVREREVRVGGLRTVLAEAGPADAEEAVVFVHGNPGSALDWHDLMGRTGEFARAVALDMPGFGRADKPRDFPVPLAGHAAFLGAALDDLGVKRAHLVLHDFGGPWGLGWAGAHQDAFASVVLMNTGFLIGFEPHDMARRWQKPVVGELVMALTNRAAWRKAFAKGDARPLPRAYVDQMYDHYDRGTRRTVLRLYRAPRITPEAMTAIAEAFAPLDRPALILWGGKDPYVPVRHAEQQLIAFPGARVEILPDSGHWPFADDPEGVAAQVVPFLEAQTAR